MLKRRKSKKTDRKYWIDQLDRVFSLYIRMRDSRAYGYKAFRCISCGDVKPFEMMDCGHFVSRNCMVLRWNEQNCSGECSRCNRMLGDHLLGYRKNLIVKLGADAIKGTIAESLEGKKRLEVIKRIGEQKVQALESQKYTTKKWSVEELQEMYQYYAALVIKMKEEM